MTAEFHFPDPKINDQRTALAEALERGGEIVDALREREMHHEANAVNLSTIAEVRDRAYTLARTLGLQAVSDGVLTRADVARTLGTHPQTVAAWIEQAKTDPEHDYVSDPLNGARFHAR